MASTWLLATDRTPQQVADAIQVHLDPQDLFFVCELKSQYQGRLPKPAWDWIKAELGTYDWAAALSALGLGGELGGSTSTLDTTKSEAVPGLLPWLLPPKTK